MNYRWHRLQSLRDPCFPPQRSNTAAFFNKLHYKPSARATATRDGISNNRKGIWVQRWRDYKPKVNYGCSVLVLIPVWVCVFDHIYWIAEFQLHIISRVLKMIRFTYGHYMCVSMFVRGVTGKKRTICGHTHGPGRIRLLDGVLARVPSCHYN